MTIICSPLLFSYCLISMEMLPSCSLKQREVTLTKQPSLQALLKDYQSGASTSSKIGKPSSQALLNFRRFLLLLIDSSQCGRGDPRFGRSAVSQKLWDNNLIMFLPFSYLYFSLFEINLTHHCSCVGLSSAI